jgi:hypothetical protein
MHRAPKRRLELTLKRSLLEQARSVAHVYEHVQIAA